MTYLIEQVISVGLEGMKGHQVVVEANVSVSPIEKSGKWNRLFGSIQHATNRGTHNG